MPLWPMQERGICLTLNAIEKGIRRILLTSPTGTGKSRLVCELIDRLAEQQWYAVLYTNRRLLIEQLQRVLTKHGFDVGVRAAGYDHRDDAFWPVQISSLPTEASRVLKKGRWDIHGKGRQCIAIVDEAHLNAGTQARAIMQRHVEAGHTVLGVTATPLDLEGVYDELLIAGTVSEGQRCGALVEAIAYDFASPDLKGVKAAEGEDLSEPQIRKAMMRPGLIGRVFDAFDQLNPDRRPSLGFAPGVEESIWFAEEFTKRGVKAAHIDGEHIWIDGELHDTSPELRRQVIEASKDDIKVLWNRFVLREGIDAPWLAHGILATIMGSLQTFLQSGGRLLRACEGKTCATFQDHGANFMRHGSLNEDREWFLEQTATMAYARRADRMRQNPERQPFRCPKCGRVWVRGTICNPARGGCGHKLNPFKKSREVVMADGVLRRVGGDFFSPGASAATRKARPSGSACTSAR
jgi:DNA repair protein RadD